MKTGGTPYFRIAAVWVPSLADADRFRSSVQQLRIDLGLPQGFEFKYSKTHRSPELRAAFFAAALGQEFRFAFSSIDKTDDDWIYSDRQRQHWACVTELAAVLRPVYHQVEESNQTSLRELIVVDDNADREFLELIKRQFRGLKSKSRPSSSMMGKVIFRDSIDDAMLQLADMICGSVGAMIDGYDRDSYDLIVERSLNFLSL